jgi:hypothetical protein
MFQTTTLINWCAILNIEVSNNESKRSAFLKRWHRHSGSIEVFLLSRYQDPWSKNAILLALYHNVVFAYKVLIRADSSGKTATIKFCKFEDVKETVKFKLSASNFLEWSLKLFLCEISDKYYLNRSAFTDGWVSKKFSPMHVCMYAIGETFLLRRFKNVSAISKQYQFIKMKSSNGCQFSPGLPDFFLIQYTKMGKI